MRIIAMSSAKTSYERAPKKFVICGFGRDVDKLWASFPEARILASETCALTGCPSLFSGEQVDWVSLVLRTEINLLDRWEQEGSAHLFFFLNKERIKTRWLDDYLYITKYSKYPKDYGKKSLAFGFSAWELKYLLPMFPAISTIVWSENEF